MAAGAAVPTATGGGGRLGAWARQHRRTLLLAGGGGAVVLGLLSFRARGSSGSPAAMVAPGATGAYDSTANDIYSSIQPQIGALYDAIAKLSTPTAALPRVGSGSHKVLKGETLMSLAKLKLGKYATVQDLTKYANDIKASNKFIGKDGKLKPGWIITLPAALIPQGS